MPPPITSWGGGRGTFLDIYFWSHLPFFPNQRQPMKNKTSCRAPPLPAWGLSPWGGMPGMLPTLENSQKQLCPLRTDEGDASP